MLRRISSKSLAEVFFVMLLLVTFFYYIFPGNDSLFMLFGQLVGIVFYALMAFAIISVNVLMIKLAIKYYKK